MKILLKNAVLKEMESAIEQIKSYILYYSSINERVSSELEQETNQGMIEVMLNHKEENLKILNNYKIQYNVLVNDHSTFTLKLKIANFFDKPNISTVKYNSFIESVKDNALVFGHTQVGKTATMYEIVANSLSRGINVVISCDNKTDQLVQNMERIQLKNTFVGVEFLRVDSKFEKNISNNIKSNKNFVAFCLNNESQIKRIKNALISHKKELTDKYLCIISDEGDIITKDKDTEKENNMQPKSHREWIKLLAENKNIMIKRFFVTATPENLVLLYNIENPYVFNIPAPLEYSGYKSMQYRDIESYGTAKLVKNEVTRIIRDTEDHKGGEVILFCTERKITEGQYDLLLRASKLDFLKNIVINTYNGHGIYVYSLNKKLPERLKKDKIYYEINEDNLIHIKLLSIDKFYNICQDLNEKCVMTIGYDLIQRGISYVSSNRNFPLCATTMFYRPGVDSHCVGNAQAIGRITGTARPDLLRTLYTTEKVYTNYMSYCKNQEQYITEIQNNPSQNTRVTVQNLVLNERITCPVDRPRLKLEKLFVYKEIPDYTKIDENVMKHYIDLWWNASTIIGKVLNFVYERKEVREQELKNYMKSINCVNSHAYYIDLIRPDRNFCSVFEKLNNQISIKKEAINYIKTK